MSYNNYFSASVNYLLRKSYFKIESFMYLFFCSWIKKIVLYIEKEFFSYINNAVFCKSRRLQNAFLLKNWTSEYSLPSL